MFVSLHCVAHGTFSADFHWKDRFASVLICLWFRWVVGVGSYDASDRDWRNGRGQAGRRVEPKKRLEMVVFDRLSRPVGLLRCWVRSLGYSIEV